MNCQQIQTAIDTVSRREALDESVHRHLTSCQGCRGYADEMSALFSLLTAAPRVVAPGDFDFRLRARIAAVQAERRGPFSFLENFWSLSFSFGRAATAMAAIALVATFTTLYFVNHRPANQSGEVANLAAPSPAPTKSQIVEPPPVPPHQDETVAVASLPSAPATKGAGLMKATAKNTAGSRLPAASRVEFSEQGTSIPVIEAGTTIIIKSRNGTARMVTVPEVTYGQPRLPMKAAKDEAPAATQVIF